MSLHADPIDFELFKNALFAAADEMAVTVCRTTYSGVLRDNMDFSTSITDARGSVVAQGLTLPMHLGSVRTALAAVLAHYDNDMREGDVYALNDPFEGGMHLPDVLHVQAGVRERRARGVRLLHRAPGGHRRPGPRLERGGFDRDLPGGAADPADEAARRRRAQRHPVAPDRAQRAHPRPGVRGSARPARGLRDRRARDPRADRPVRHRARPRDDAGDARLHRTHDEGGALEAPGRRVPTSRTGSTTTVSISASPSGSSSPCASRAIALPSTGPAARRRSRARSTRPSP